MTDHRVKEALCKICKSRGNGDEKEVKKIVDAHPSIINEVLDSHGNTILLLATFYNHIKIIQFLLSIDSININKQSNRGYTALHLASCHGYKEIVELLLIHNNIDITIQNNDRKLASEICCRRPTAIKSNKPIILEFFKKYSEAKASSTTATPRSNEGTPNNVIDQSNGNNLKLSPEIEQEIVHHAISKPGGEQSENNENRTDQVQTEEEENYMKEALLSGKKEWGRGKIMIVGEGRAGKTALANSILGRKYQNTESTVGINEFTCDLGYANVGESNADGLWSEYKREKQQKEYEVALAKMIFDKKTGREQMKRSEREELDLEVLLWNKNQGGYLQGEEEGSKTEGGKRNIDSNSNQDTTGSVHHNIVSIKDIKAEVNENVVDDTVKKTEIDKSLVMQYLGEKSCVDSKFVISVFDFGGQSVFNVIHPFFLTRFGVYLLAFNMEWLGSNASMEVKEDCLSYITFWLNSIIIHTQNEKGEVAPIFFVGTRKDIVSSPAEHLKISTMLYEGFSGSLAWPYVIENVGADGPDGRADLCFYPINNTLSNHDSTMQSLLKKIEETIDSSLYVHVERPLSWFRVIDALKETNVPYMRYKEAERIITDCDIPRNKVSLLLRFLHEMGILMWHDEDKLRDVVVFDPIEYFVKPATIVICKHVPDEASGIYHVLDIHRTVRKVHGRDFLQMTRHGIVTEKLLKALLQHHEENYVHISQLMLKYAC